MSLVGPRPHAVQHNEEYARLIRGYFARHRVKPGMTGWAQVRGFRGETKTLEQMEVRVQYDMYYVENWSLFFDLKVLPMTAVICLTWLNAYCLVLNIAFSRLVFSAPCLSSPAMHYPASARAPS